MDGWDDDRQCNGARFRFMCFCRLVPAWCLLEQSTVTASRPIATQSVSDVSRLDLYYKSHLCWFSFLSISRQDDVGVCPYSYQFLSSSLSIQHKTSSRWPRHRKRPLRRSPRRGRTQSCHADTLKVKSPMASISLFSTIECSRWMRGSNFTLEETSLLNTWSDGMRRTKSMRTVS